MLGTLAVVASGAAIVAVGIYFWSRPEQYYRYLYRASLLADLGKRPPAWAVKLGAGLTIVIGIVVVGWAALQLVP